jgi:hypothetical protein
MSSMRRVALRRVFYSEAHLGIADEFFEGINRTGNCRRRRENVAIGGCVLKRLLLSAAEAQVRAIQLWPLIPSFEAMAEPAQRSAKGRFAFLLASAKEQKQGAESEDSEWCERWKNVP